MDHRFSNSPVFLRAYSRKQVHNDFPMSQLVLASGLPALKFRCQCFIDYEESTGGNYSLKRGQSHNLRDSQRRVLDDFSPKGTSNVRSKSEGYPFTGPPAPTPPPTASGASPSGDLDGCDWRMHRVDPRNLDSHMVRGVLHGINTLRPNR